MANSLKTFLRTSQKVRLKSVIANDVFSTTSGRRHTSTLFISGRYASNTFSFLTPYIDFSKKFLDIDKFQRELSLRGVDVSATELRDKWNFYKALAADRAALEDTMQKLGEESRNTKKGEVVLSDAEKQRRNKFRLQFRILKEELKNIKEVLWDMEEIFLCELLKLPNEIDEDAPLESSVVLKEVGTLKKVSEEDRKSHVDIGENFGVLEYTNPTQIYLCGEGALFELATLKYAAEVFNREGMIRVSGADFCRSTVIEAAGLNHIDPMDSFILRDHVDVKKSLNRMHVVGGASLMSFLAIHARQLINPRSLPLKYFATGRQYVPCRDDLKLDGLFTACQSSSVHVFLVIKERNSNEYKQEFDNLLNTVCNLYNNICDHYRVVTRSVAELKPWETMRVSFEIWSQFHEQYVEVGHISAHSDYFSKRLLIAYQTPYGRDFPVMISGTVLSVSKLLGCLLEENPYKFVIPEEIIKRMPIDEIETHGASVNSENSDLNAEEESTVKVRKQ